MNKKAKNRALPQADGHSDGLRKDQAFTTLAVEEFSLRQGEAKPPLSSDAAVEQARAWVEHNKL